MNSQAILSLTVTEENLRHYQKAHGKQFTWHLTNGSVNSELSCWPEDFSDMFCYYHQQNDTQQGNFGDGLSITHHLCFLPQLTFFLFWLHFGTKTTQGWN